MKRLIVFLILFTIYGNLWARDFSLSTGAGGLMGGLFTRYTLKADGKKAGLPMKVDAGQDTTQLNYGGLVFFDATYAELCITIQNGINKWTQNLDIEGLEGSKPSTGDGWETMMGFAILGKYPFNLGSRLTVFPLLGMEYQISLRQLRTQPDGWVYDRSDGIRERDKDKNAFELSDWNSFFLDVGGGADFDITENIFIRGEFIYSFRLMTNYEKKNLEATKAMTGDNSPSMGGLTSGPSLRVCAGYRFF